MLEVLFAGILYSSPAYYCHHLEDVQRVFYLLQRKKTVRGGWKHFEHLVEEERCGAGELNFLVQRSLVSYKVWDRSSSRWLKLHIVEAERDDHSPVYLLSSVPVID